MIPDIMQEKFDTARSIELYVGECEMVSSFLNK
jgi:hypothetical protein